MATCLPFNSVNHDRVYKAEDWAWYFSTFISNGVFPSPSNGLQVLAEGNSMNVLVQPGFGFANGYAFRNEEALSFTISDADGVADRIDRLVLRLNLAERNMYLVVLEGTPSKSPSAPSITRTADLYEMALCDISVSKGLVSITQANITDQRWNSDLCGIVAGTITQIDASTITLQFNQYFVEYKAEMKVLMDELEEEIEDIEKGAGVELAKKEFTNTVVPATSFVEDSTSEDYPYRAKIELENVIETMVPFLVFSEADSTSGIFSPVAETYNGGVYIYSTEVPSDDITIPTIICWRGSN